MLLWILSPFIHNIATFYRWLQHETRHRNLDLLQIYAIVPWPSLDIRDDRGTIASDSRPFIAFKIDHSRFHLITQEGVDPVLSWRFAERGVPLIIYICDHVCIFKQHSAGKRLVECRQFLVLLSLR